jgi:hypothetical protein
MTRTDIVAEGLLRRLAVLGAAGFGVGLGLALGGRSAEQRSFGRQTAAWGAIDLAIAAVGHTRRSAPVSRSRLRTILLVNTALDVGYVAAGAHVAVHRSSFGGRLTPEAARGHGAAVVAQGTLLFALDLLHARLLSGPILEAVGDGRKAPHAISRLVKENGFSERFRRPRRAELPPPRK